VRVLLVNYENPMQGILKLRRCRLGEVTISDGMYVAELRGTTQKLQMTVGEVDTPDCAATLAMPAAVSILGLSRIRAARQFRSTATGQSGLLKPSHGAIPTTRATIWVGASRALIDSVVRRFRPEPTRALKS
jgi:hypothetical protein